MDHPLPMSTSTPKPGPHLSTRPVAVTHTRPLSPSAARLAPFAVVDLPVGPSWPSTSTSWPTLTASELYPLAALALQHLASARFYALLALGVEEVRP